ncbi:hypothetical protein VT52_008195 [Streptomyces malaysiense]|uniref:Uncharacterized protein n=1 Tax=Streptomyces malaysiense TaxID=1428626 RepID=A0A1J4Q6I5_9ACTN|nr:hypothetical protein VT52_008195 [Streptomyces malaysiense]
MGAFAGPDVLILAAAVILVVKYRRRMAGRAPLIASGGAAGRVAVTAAFALGCVWARTQGPSLVDAVVLGLSLALLTGAAAALLARGRARRG